MIFKKNKSRPPINISLRKINDGYRVIPDQKLNPFIIKRVARLLPRVNIKQHKANNDVVSGNISSTAAIMCSTHVTLPSSAKWFDLNHISQIQEQTFSQFFVPSKQGEGLSFSRKDIHLYMYYRNSIVALWRENSKKHLSACVCRKNIIGDAGSIIRIHAFLQNWGIINFPSKQHKGYPLDKPNLVECYVCQNSEGPFYVAPVQDDIFQICENCYNEDKFPLFIEKQTFKRIINPDDQNKQLMNTEQINKMLGLLNNMPKDKDAWSAVSKQMPNFSKQQVLMNFLLIPIKQKMNVSIFEDGQDNFLNDVISNKQPSTIFQDFSNPIQTSVAMAYYEWKKNSEQNQKLGNYFQAAEKHSKYLAKVQSKKIDSMTKMLVELVLSKLELKILFLKEYQKLIESQQASFKKCCINTIVQTLKQNPPQTKI